MSWSREFVEKLLRDGSIVATWNMPSQPISETKYIVRLTMIQQVIRSIYHIVLEKVRWHTSKKIKRSEFHFNSPVMF